MEADPAASMTSSKIHDDPAKNVVQVDGMVCVGVPIGSLAIVQALVAAKTRKLVEDDSK